MAPEAQKNSHDKNFSKIQKSFSKVAKTRDINMLKTNPLPFKTMQQFIFKPSRRFYGP